MPRAASLIPAAARGFAGITLLSRNPLFFLILDPVFNGNVTPAVARVSRSSAAKEGSGTH
jgi:hypothetical protein